MQRRRRATKAPGWPGAPHVEWDSFVSLTVSKAARRQAAARDRRSLAGLLSLFCRFSASGAISFLGIIPLHFILGTHSRSSALALLSMGMVSALYACLYLSGGRLSDLGKGWGYQYG